MIESNPQGPPEDGLQNIPRPRLGPVLRQQEESDGFDDPNSSERLTEVPIGEFYPRFRDEIVFIVESHLIEQERHLKPTTMRAYRKAAEGLTKRILTDIDEHRIWEAKMIDEMNDTKNARRALLCLRPDKWDYKVDILELNLTTNLHMANRMSQCSDLSAELSNLLIEKIDICVGEHLSQLRLLYMREFQGAWWKFYRMIEFGFPRLRQTDYAIFHGIWFLIAGFFHALYWFVAPLWLEEDDINFFTVFSMLDIIVNCLMLPFSSGKLAFYLCSFRPSVKPLYEHATKSIAWAEGNWPSSRFGFEFTWCFWKKRSDGFVPQVGPYTDVEYKGGKYVLKQNLLRRVSV
ncbi:hypothetical protein PUMCH_002679 [Australozyma saopauloensis]|uniref:Anoctamin n=1 Tax=Australozyma saopauloensis TaxID=291208 RepID=A0AAX4H9Y6_9ASCO|nr:hypothetical protein PUMCH_002679 [[Candida] saopauloensis]